MAVDSPKMATEASEIDTTGLTRPAQVESPLQGIRTEQVATVRLHAELPDGRTIQIMPTGDIRGVVPKGAKIIWHERMGLTPQDVALAGQPPTSGAEVLQPLSGGILSDADLAARVAGVETEIQRLREELAARPSMEVLAEREAELEELRAALDERDAAGDPKRVRTAIKPGPSLPVPAAPAATSGTTPTEKAK
jgi:uncharacterized small protein (DUF1192 family)